jgi:hypothetical protein
MGLKVMNWFHLSQDVDQCQTVMMTAMNFRLELKTY